MTKKMEENINGPFQGGLSVFNMDFATKGLSWAGNVYQKWENIRLDNITSQNPSKYVDAFGEHFRKICEEVADDWLNPFSDGCVKGPVSDLSLEHDVIAEVCKKSKIGLDECAVNEKSSPPTEWEPFVSSREQMSLASLPDVSQDASHEKAYDMPIKKSILSPVEVRDCNCSDEARENLKKKEGKNLKKVSDPVAPVAILSGSWPSVDELPLSESTENKVLERGLIASLPSVSEDTSHGKAYDMPIKKSIPSHVEVRDYNCSDKARENLKKKAGGNLKKFTDPVASIANLSGNWPSVDVVPLSESTENKVVERGLMLSGCTSLTELRGAFTSQETMSLVESFGNEHEQQNKPNELETSPPLLKIGSLDHFGIEATGGHDAVNANTEPIEEFEDVKLEDCWDDSEKDELALISQQANKKMSYKKKLRDALTSKVRSSKKSHEQAAIWYSGSDVGPVSRMGIAASSVSPRVLNSETLSSQHSCESDWELL